MSIMARNKRYQLTLSHGSELRYLRDWMQKDVPAKLTISQACDAAILMLHELATTTTSRLFYLPKLEVVTRRIWMRATVKVLGQVLPHFGLTCDIDLSPDGNLTVTRLSDGQSITAEAFTDEQVREAMRSADSSAVSPSSLRVS